VNEGALCKIKRNTEGEYNWQNMVVLSKDYPRAVQRAMDEQDRILLGIAGMEIEPLVSRVITNPELCYLKIWATRLDYLLPSLTNLSGSFLGHEAVWLLIAVRFTLFLHPVSDSIIRMAYNDDGFGDPTVILKTDKIISGLAVKNRP
jgi:hypothetical protein